MPKITKQQAINRWDKLPMVLREAVFSERNADILWSVCEGQHLPENKIFRVASLVGDVLMGFIHPDDLAKEIKETLALNPIIIDSIVKEVNNKIFSPIRSEINKALALPILTEEEIEAEEAAGKAKEAEEPTISDIIKEGVKYTKPEGGEAEPMKIIPTNAGEKIVIPQSLEGSAVAEAMADKPVILQREEEFKPVSGAKKSLGELFGFLSGKEIKKEAPVAAKIEIGGNMVSPVGMKAPEAPQIVILKEILESKPEVNFPLDLLHIKPPMIIKPAEDNLLISNRDSIDIQLPKEKISEEKEKQRVVHYTDLKTPLELISDIKGEIKPLETKLEAKPFEIKIGEKDNQSIINRNSMDNQLLKEKVKIVDFTVEAAIPKKAEIDKKDNQLISEKNIPLISSGNSVDIQLPEIKLGIKPKIKEGFFRKLFSFRKKEKKKEETKDNQLIINRNSIDNQLLKEKIIDIQLQKEEPQIKIIKDKQ